MSTTTQSTTEASLLAKRAHERLLANARAKKWYDKNKAPKIEYMRARRVADKANYNDVLARMAILTHNDVVQNQSAEDEEEQHSGSDFNYAPEPERRAVRGKKTQAPKAPLFTLEYIHEIIRADTVNIKVDKNTTRRKYIADITRAFDGAACKDLISCLVNYKQVVDRILNFKQKNGELYANNSHVGYIQVLLFVMDNYLKPYMNASKFKTAHTYINKIFDKLKLQSRLDKTQKQATTIHISFDEYVKRIKALYKTTSKQYLLAKIYEACTARDDYGEGMRVITHVDGDNDKTTNYLLKTQRGAYTFIFNSYKTSKADKPFIFKLNLPEHTELCGLLDNWIVKHTIEHNGYLFGSSLLSGYISTMNQSIGVKGAINTTRQIKVTSVLSNMNVTAEERVRLSEQMMHSPITQLAYQMSS